MELPEAEGPVIVRSERGELALAFRQEEATSRRVDQALAFVSSRATVAA